MILVLDNYDSFTFNIVQALGALGGDPRVVKSDQIALSEIERLAPVAIVISPGPGRPEDAGVSAAAVGRFVGRVPVLGVCLGHQVLCAALGASVVRAKRLFHGRTSRILHDGSGLFHGLPDGFRAARYHSLVVDPTSLPADLVATAYADSGELMAVRHVRHAAFGVQFHPESFMTERGARLLANFLQTSREARAAPLGEEPQVG